MAYAGQYQNAMAVLNAADNQNDPRILNYKGFTNRKIGNIDVAMDFYKRAIALDADYVLARSYMGQGYITLGDRDAAMRELDEIEARVGKEDWAYVSLAKALKGEATNY